MRKASSTTIIAVALGTLTLIANQASAGSLRMPPLPDRHGVQAVQYYGSSSVGRGDEWDRRRQWREWRQERDEARIAEAVRRESQMIEQEREQRRAWRHAWREQQGGGYGGGYGYQRGW